MVKLRQTMVNGFGVATLCIFLAIVVGNVQVLQAGLAPWPGIGTIALATAAFVVSWKQNSLGMTGLLIAAGVTGIIAGHRNYNRTWDIWTGNGKSYNQAVMIFCFQPVPTSTKFINHTREVASPLYNSCMR
jgi:hypothetical protein